MSASDTAAYALSLATEANQLEQRISSLLRGRRARIRPDSHFNGQPYGRSKPRLAGLEVQIESASVNQLGGVWVFLKGHRYALDLNELELLP